MIYNYDVFLAQVKSFSLLRSSIINSCTFQHGHPRYLGTLQKWSCLNNLCSYEPYFLDLENDKIRKNMSDLRLTSVKTIQKVSDVITASWCCVAPLFTIEPVMRKLVLCHMRTRKAQISLRIRTVSSAPLLFAA